MEKERLILNYENTDGYSYSDILDVPIIYKSKDDAIRDFKEILLNHITRTEKNHKESHEVYIEKEEIKKTMFGVISEEKNEKYHSLVEKFDELQNELKSDFSFGGRSFYYSDFIRYDREKEKEEIFLPTIMTLDEFYESAEKKLEEEASNKKSFKMK